MRAGLGLALLATVCAAVGQEAVPAVAAALLPPWRSALQNCHNTAYKYCCVAGVPCNCSATVTWPGQCKGDAYQYVANPLLGSATAARGRT
jgi:hypothetical protein